MCAHGFGGGGAELDLQASGYGRGFEGGDGEAVGGDAVGEMKGHCGDLR